MCAYSNVTNFLIDAVHGSLKQTSRMFVLKQEKTVSLEKCFIQSKWIMSGYSLKVWGELKFEWWGHLKKKSILFQ